MKCIKILVLAILLALFAINVFAQTCVPEPNCTAMGYVQTEEDCSGLNFIRCPFNQDAVYCGGDTCPETVTCTETACKTECDGNCVECEPCPAPQTCAHCNKTCDGNCVECSTCTYTNTSKPANCSSASSCTFNNKSYYSNTCNKCSSPYILNSSKTCICPDIAMTCISPATCETECGGKCIECNMADRSEFFDGRGNTAAIIAQIGTEGTAATACNLFYPPEVSSSDTNFGAGKWYLPALGELIKMYGLDSDCASTITSSSIAASTCADAAKGKTKVNISLTSAGGSALSTRYNYWSSTQLGGTQYNVWGLSMSDGARTTSNKSSNLYVRCFLLLEDCFHYSTLQGSAPQIGDIMFSDKTWSNGTVSGKTPIGVVVDVYGPDVTIVNLKDLKSGSVSGNFNASSPYSNTYEYMFWSRGWEIIDALEEYYSTTIALTVKDYKYW